MTHTLTLEALFSDIEVERLTESLSAGFVKHDAEMAEVMTEATEDYFPGMRMVVIEDFTK